MSLSAYYFKWNNSGTCTVLFLQEVVELKMNVLPRVDKCEMMKRLINKCSMRLRIYR